MSEPSAIEESSRIGENGTSTVAHRSNSDRLQKLLARLKHLNLTGLIKDVKRLSGAHGGYSDMYYGLLPRPNSEGGIEQKKVAIKQLRVYLYEEQDFAKVWKIISSMARQ